MKDSNVEIGMRVQIKNQVPNFSENCGVVMDKDCWFLMGECFRILFDDDSESYFLASEFKKVKA